MPYSAANEEIHHTQQQQLQRQVDFNYLMQNFVYFLKSRQKLVTDNNKAISTSNVPYAYSKNSSNTFVSYRKTVHDRLREINNNVTNVITESCSGIDDLCNRVRECLSEMQYAGNNARYYNSLSQISPIVENIRPSLEEPNVNEGFSMYKNLNIKDFPIDEIEELKLKDSEEIMESIVYDEGLEKPKLEKDNTEIKRLPSFITFLNINSESCRSISKPRQKLSLINFKNQSQKRKILLKVLKNGILNEDYTNDIMDEIVDSIHKEIENLSKTTITMMENHTTPDINPKEALKDKHFELNCDSIHKEIENLSKMTSKMMEHHTMPDINPKEALTGRNVDSNCEREIENKSKASEKCIQVAKVCSKCSSTEKNNSVDYRILETGIDINLFKNADIRNAIIPDLYRRPGSTDLFQKLRIQIEASDSLIYFQKLMSRTKLYDKKINAACMTKKLLNSDWRNFSILEKPNLDSSVTIRQTKKALRKKYSNSLWFSQNGETDERKSSKGSLNKRKRKSNRKNNLSRNSSSKCSQKSLSTFSNFSSNCLLHFSGPPSTVTLGDRRASNYSSRKSPSINKSLQETLTPKSTTATICPRGSYCITKIHNETPSDLSTKCRIRWMCAKNAEAPVRKLECLSILDDLTNRDLLPLRSEYPRKDVDNWDENKSVESTYLYRLMEEEAPNTWNHLLQPNLECSEKDCNVCDLARKQPRKIIAGFKNNANEKKYPKTEQVIGKQNLSRNCIIHKLQPYIFDPKYKNQSAITVLPVQVFYDKYRTEVPTRLDSPKSLFQKCSIVSLKESNLSNRAKWNAPDTPKRNIKEIIWQMEMDYPTASM